MFSDGFHVVVPASRETLCSGPIQAADATRSPFLSPLSHSAREGTKNRN